MARITKSINSIGRCHALYRRMRMDGELEPYFHPYLLAISRAPGRTQDEIASDICVNKSVASRRLDALEEQGYVRRVPKPEDRRCLLIYPTDKCLAILPEIKAISDDWLSLISAGIGEDELRAFEEVLFKIEKNAREIIYGKGENKK